MLHEPQIFRRGQGPISTMTFCIAKYSDWVGLHFVHNEIPIKYRVSIYDFWVANDTFCVAFCHATLSGKSFTLISGIVFVFFLKLDLTPTKMKLSLVDWQKSVPFCAKDLSFPSATDLKPVNKWQWFALPLFFVPRRVSLLCCTFFHSPILLTFPA